MELIALIASILWCRQRDNDRFDLFIPLLLLTVGTETTGALLGYAGYTNNSFLYNVYGPAEFLFISFLLQHWILDRTLKMLVRCFMILQICFAIGNIIWFQGFYNLNSYTIIVEALLLVAFSCIYLFDLFQHSDQISNPVRLSKFWIISGVIFFNLGEVVMIALYDYARKNELNLNGVRLFDVIFIVINAILYGSFIIGFRLCYLDKRQRSLSS